MVPLRTKGIIIIAVVTRAMTVPLGSAKVIPGDFAVRRSSGHGCD